MSWMQNQFVESHSAENQPVEQPQNPQIYHNPAEEQLQALLMALQPQERAAVGGPEWVSNPFADGGGGVRPDGLEAGGRGRMDAAGNFVQTGGGQQRPEEQTFYRQRLGKSGQVIETEIVRQGAFGDPQAVNVRRLDSQGRITGQVHADQNRMVMSGGMDERHLAGALRAAGGSQAPGTGQFSEEEKLAYAAKHQAVMSTVRHLSDASENYRQQAHDISNVLNTIQGGATPDQVFRMVFDPKKGSGSLVDKYGEDEIEQHPAMQRAFPELKQRQQEAQQLAIQGFAESRGVAPQDQSMVMYDPRTGAADWNRGEMAAQSAYAAIQNERLKPQLEVRKAELETQKDLWKAMLLPYPKESTFVKTEVIRGEDGRISTQERFDQEGYQRAVREVAEANRPIQEQMGRFRGEIAAAPEVLRREGPGAFAEQGPTLVDFGSQEILDFALRNRNLEPGTKVRVGARIFTVDQSRMSVTESE